MKERCGVGVSAGSFATAEALKKFGAKRIAILSPYAKVADIEVTRFFTEAGFTVVRFKGLRCPNPIAIAEVTPEEFRGHMDELTVMILMLWCKWAPTSLAHVWSQS